MMAVDDSLLRSLSESPRLGDDADPARWVELWEEAEYLQKQLAALSEAQRMVLRLRYWDDLSIRDIAVLTRRTEVATRQFLHRALVALRQTIEVSAEDD